jgi:hypothetical protein
LHPDKREDVVREVILVIDCPGRDDALGRVRRAFAPLGIEVQLITDLREDGLVVAVSRASWEAADPARIRAALLEACGTEEYRLR